MDLLVIHGIADDETMIIVTFVTIAFVRKLLPHVKWPTSYIVAQGEHRSEKPFSDNHRYVIIENETNAYWNCNLKKEIVLNVAGRSKEFNVVNKLLLQGGRLEFVRLSKTVVIC